MATKKKRGRPTKAASEKRTERLVVRLTPDEMRRLRGWADWEGADLPDYVREQLFRGK